MGKRALVDLQICIEPCAQGIIQEALNYDDRSRAKAAEMAEELRRYWGKSRREVSALCMAFYTSDTSLYFVLNKALRECDLTKLDTLGPYAYLLGEHAHFGVEYCGTVYRGAQLIPDHIEEYKRALGTWKSWPAFSSTCKIRCAAETYGNTLFIIEITAARDERSLSFDVSGISNFSQEEEVIIMPGTLLPYSQRRSRSSRELHHTSPNVTCALLNRNRCAINVSPVFIFRFIYIKVREHRETLK